MGQFAAGGRFDLILSFRYSLDESELERWMLTFQAASELLYIATDRQHQLGKVWVCANESGGKNADFWLLPSATGSSANARLWEPFKHCQLDSKVQLRPFTIVHELGHYLYALGDENKEPPNSVEAEPWATCLGYEEDDHPTACIMETHHSWGDRWTSDRPDSFVEGDVIHFCFKDNHDKPRRPRTYLMNDAKRNNTVQSKRHRRSCWNTMQLFYPDLQIPKEFEKVRPDGAGTIEWIPLLDEKRYVLVTDLNALDPLGPISPTALVEELIQGFARRAPASDYYGAVITFGDSTYTGDLKAAIRRAPWPRSVPGVLSQLPKRDRLDLTEMLAAAGRLIAYAGDQAATQVTALVSFGWIDAGDYPFVAAEALRTAGIRLYTYEAAPFHQLALLRSLARLTGGEYASFPAHRPEWVTMLRAHLADLCHLTHEEGGLVTADGAIVDTSNADLPNSASPDIGDDSSDSGGDPPDLARFESTIEKGCRSAVFTAEWDSDAPFEMVIDSPDDESFEESPQDAQARDPSDRFRVIDVESPSAGTWCTRIVLRRDEGPYRGPPVEVQHRVHVGASRVKFGLSVDQPSYSLGETVEIVGQVAAEAILSGVRMHGSITDPLGRVSGLDLVEVPSGRTGCRGEGSGFHRTRFTPTVEGPHEVIVVADNLDRSAVLATGGDSASEDVEFAWRPPAFTRRASVTVFVEDPPGPPCRATPDRLSRAEDTRVKIRFDRIPWIPGVSRLDLGDGVKAVEDLKAVGEVPTFEITVARGAAAGSRGAAVITSGKRFWIPRLLVIDR